MTVGYCMICNSSLSISEVYLCKRHTEEIISKLSTNAYVIKTPTEREHCHISGEFNNRLIINFSDLFLFM